MTISKRIKAEVEKLATAAKRAVGTNKEAQEINKAAIGVHSIHMNSVLFIILAAVSMVGLFLMTGLVYFRSEVTIVDRGVTTRGYTMNSDPYDMLDEQGFTLGELDTIVVEEPQNGEVNIVVKRATNVAIRVVEHDSEETIVVKCGAENSVAELLTRAGVTLSGFDSVTPSLESAAYGLQEITVTREYDVYVEADGQIYTINTAGQTAGEILSRAGVSLSGDDFINFDESYMVQPEETIEVSRVTYSNRVSIEHMEHDVVYQDNILLKLGTETVLTEGRDGEQIITNRDTYINGEYYCTNFISSEILVQPVTTVIERGQALQIPYSKRTDTNLKLKNGIPENYLYKISGDSSAYVAKPGAVTASGRTLQIGTVGVDPDVIPYGSELYIVSQDHSYVYGYAVAADTGYITNILVDCFYGWDDNAYWGAVQYGGKLVDIYVLGVATR